MVPVLLLELLLPPPLALELPQGQPFSSSLSFFFCR